MNQRYSYNNSKKAKVSVQSNKRRGFRFYILVAAVVLFSVLISITVLSSCGESNAPSDETDKTDVSGIERNTDIADSEKQKYDFRENVGKYPVEYAAYTDNTATFSEDFSFSSAILIDLKNNEVLAADNAEDRMYPASLTKIMTLIVAVENCTDLDKTFTMTADIIDPLYLENASVAGFSAGENITVRDMLYGLILPSGADAAVGLAEFVAGSEAEFVKLMNEKVKTLGLKDTRFMNASGLHHPNHYSTCHEMALILEYALKNDTMLKILSTYQYTTTPTAEHPEGILLTSTLFSRMYGNEPECAFVVGGKTGYTIEAHHCLATFAVKCTEDESEEAIYAKSPDMILVTVGSSDRWGPIFNAIDIYSAFSNPTAEIKDRTVHPSRSR